MSKSDQAELEATAAKLRQSAWLLEQFYSALRDQKVPEDTAAQWVDTWFAAKCLAEYGAGWKDTDEG